MAIQTELIIFEMVIITLFVFAFRKTFRNWKDSKNRMYIAVNIIAGLLIANSIFNLISYSLAIDIGIYVIGYIKIGIFLSHIMFVVQFEFILYLLDLKKFYTLPFIAAFYLLIGQYLIASIFPFIIYAAILTYISSYLLIRNGNKNRNGLAFGMGLFFLIWGFGYSLQTIQIPIVLHIFKITAAVTFLLGTVGFYEKFIFPNREDEAKIMGTWISKLVIKE